MKAFSCSACYYDLLYKEKKYDDEVDHLKKIIQQYITPVKSILELGCGTGNYSLRLIDKDIELVGIDLNKSMIDIANEKKNNINPVLAKKITFHQGNICNLNLNKNFDVAVSMFHVISYLKTNNELLNAFNSIYKHLNSGGIFIFDCWYGPAVLTERPYERIKTFSDKMITINRTALPVMKPNENIVDIKFNYEVITKDNSERKQFSEIHSMRYYFKPELELLLNTVGFSILNYFEFMTYNKASFNTWNVCFVCQKN